MLESAIEWVRSEAPALLVLLATVLTYSGERRVHHYNYDYLTAVGGEELIAEQMKRLYALVWVLPFVAYFTALILPNSLAPWKATFPGLLLITFGFVLRTWSERTLGRLWTERCIYIPDMPRAVSGPYRFLRHPEYLARGAESLGMVLFFGINPISLLLWLRFLVLMARVSKVESRQLHELSASPLAIANSRRKEYSRGL